jgi:ribonuclease VapC
VIVIDTSALVAILNQEPPASELAAKLNAVARRVISPVNRLESIMVASRAYRDPVAEVESIIGAMQIELLPIDAVHAEWAQRAFLIYGKGRHPARLNLGDCFAYAAAKTLDAPLLFVGDDFSKTDIRVA